MPSVFQSQQARARKVHVIRLHRFHKRCQRQAAVLGVGNRLWLDRAEYRSASGLVLVGMCLHADQIFVTPLAMGEQGTQVGLGATGHEHAFLETKRLRQA
ncbi:MAG: hypothetical protein BWZ07_03081 [Alphaproteobacteria bacterium ADurb.BinA280]|nr:MAG: hypothetical protein BWZ07_03081 [Alphaproteobacteria bacterium ADurb.BinA280]